MKKIIFVQISDRIMMQQNDGFWIDDYYETVYTKMPGYYKPKHFMEIPYWVAVISGMLDKAYDRELHVVTDIQKSVSYLKKQNSLLLLSVIDSSLVATRRLLKMMPEAEFIAGGHVDPAVFGAFRNVKYLDDVQSLAQHLNTDIDVPCYDLFSGMQVIPRLTLSQGCAYNCAFCMVPRKIILCPAKDILAHTVALRALNFRLIYIDDKSFSQASNWKMIDRVKTAVQYYRPDFLGFIIQTTVSLADKPDRLREFKDLGVRYVELGIESLDHNVLKCLRKPFNLKQLASVIEKAKKLNIPILPDLIFGIPNEDHKAIVKWVYRHKEILPAINVNFLSVLHGAALARKPGKLPMAKSSKDSDQNDYRKSWLSKKETVDMLQAVRAVFYFTSGKDFVPDRLKRELQKEDIQNVLDRFLD